MRQTGCGCLGTHPGEEEGRDPAIQAAAGDPLALHLSHAVQLQAQLVSLMAVILQCRLTYDSFLLTTTSTDSCCGALADVKAFTSPLSSSCELSGDLSMPKSEQEPLQQACSSHSMIAQLTGLEP